MNRRERTIGQIVAADYRAAAVFERNWDRLLLRRRGGPEATGVKRVSLCLETAAVRCSPRAPPPSARMRADHFTSALRKSSMPAQRKAAMTPAA